MGKTWKKKNKLKSKWKDQEERGFGGKKHGK